MADKAGGITFRTHRPGDIGHIISRHGAAYADEFLWQDVRFEVMVARIGADFLDNYDPLLERCWIAERDGIFLGCIVVVRDPHLDNAAKLRLFFVEKEARGLGIGQTLLQRSVDFARKMGYASMALMTHSTLVSARSLYKRIGFNVANTKTAAPYIPGGVGVEETWEIFFNRDQELRRK